MEKIQEQTIPLLSSDTEGYGMVQQTTDSTSRSASTAAKEHKPFVISKSITDEGIMLVRLTWPICLGMIISWLPELIGTIYIGNLPNSSMLLSSVGLAKTLRFMIFMILFGTLSSLHTLLPQAVGANRKDLYPLYVQRAFYLTFIISLPFIIILYYGGTISSYLSTSTEIDYYIVDTQCRFFIITVFLEVWMCILRRMPQCINLNYQIIIAEVVGLLLSYPSCYFFITYLGWTLNGYAINLTVVYIVNITGYIYVYYTYDLLFIFKPVSFYKIFDIVGIKHYIKLAIPGTIINVFETIIFEFSIIYCQWVTSSNIAVSCAVIIISIMTFIEWTALSLSYALSIRIGKYVGAQMIDKAKQCIKCGKIIALILSSILFIIMISTRQYIPYLYTNNEEIRNLSSMLLYIITITQFFFVGVYCRYGIFRGIGKQKYPAIIIITSYYLIPFPLMFILLFVFDWKQSLMYGTICIFTTIGTGNCISSFIMEIYLSIKLNWSEIVNEAAIRLSENVHDSTSSFFFQKASSFLLQNIQSIDTDHNI